MLTDKKGHRPADLLAAHEGTGCVLGGTAWTFTGEKTVDALRRPGRSSRPTSSSCRLRRGWAAASSRTTFGALPGLACLQLVTMTIWETAAAPTATTTTRRTIGIGNAPRRPLACLPGDGRRVGES